MSREGPVPLLLMNTLLVWTTPFSLRFMNLGSLLDVKTMIVLP
jgi:hypothetical protein